MKGLLNSNPWRHYFYKDTLTYKNISPGSFGSDGLWSDGEEGIAHEIPCDIQPLGLKRLATDGGKLADCSHKIYCDPLETINLTTKIIIDGEDYQVLQVDKLGDFQIVYVKAVN